jgi:hypothetical protein
MNKLIDLTYWRFRRWLRRCEWCGQKTTKDLGKVNFSFSFEKPKKYWHYSCQVQERHKRKDQTK